ncbi:MAG: glycosyltransferase family 4 protein [Ignavibacteriales bacterium]|nr:glycosyltransferase family 4 protein [Ignavibacteriales bacterium]
MNNVTSFSKNHNLAIICFSASFGGLELTTLQLAIEFKKRNAECTLIVPAATPMAIQADKYGLRVEFFKPKMKYGDFLASLRLARLMRSRGIDIAIVMQSKDINVVAASKLFHPWTKLVFYQQMQSQINKRDVLHTWMYSKLSLWISLTNRMKQEVLQNTKVPEELIRVVPLGRDTRVFDPKLYSQRRARKRYNLPVGQPIVGVLGRLDPQKGQEEFLRSLPSVLERRSDVCYVIAGDETQGEEGYRDYLVDLTEKLGVAEHVRFLPFTENVAEFLAAIDVFVLPSYSETFGLLLIEAMAMQKPVVATSAGGVPEIVENGWDGILVPPRDERALATAIALLLKNSSLRISLSRHAREDAQKRFDATHCVDQLVLSLDSL